MLVRSAALALLLAPSHATLGVVGKQRRWHHLEERHSGATSSDRSSAGRHSASQWRHVGDQKASFWHRFGAAEGSCSGAVPSGIQTLFKCDLRGCWLLLQAPLRRSLQAPLRHPLQAPLRRPLQAPLRRPSQASFRHCPRCSPTRRSDSLQA